MCLSAWLTLNSFPVCFAFITFCLLVLCLSTSLCLFPGVFGLYPLKYIFVCMLIPSVSYIFCVPLCLCLCEVTISCLSVCLPLASHVCLLSVSRLPVYLSSAYHMSVFHLLTVACLSRLCHFVRPCSRKLTVEQMDIYLQTHLSIKCSECDWLQSRGLSLQTNNSKNNKLSSLYTLIPVITLLFSLKQHKEYVNRRLIYIICAYYQYP